MAAAPCDLGGKGVLVTRPAAQAAGLCRRIRDRGGMAIAFPTVAIAAVADPTEARALLARRWDLALYVSRNAVEYAQTLLGRLPDAQRVGAVGRATADALAAAGRAPDLVPPDRFDSEGLLALPELAELVGRRVLIVRGEGGRALLGDTLAERGATVEYAEVYRRVLPEDGNVDELIARWPNEVAVVTATSDEILMNLLSLMGAAGQPLLAATPLVVISERTAKTAAELGISQIKVAASASDEAIVEAVCELIAAT